MNIDEITQLVDNVLRQAKEISADTRAGILMGQLDERTYSNECGFLRGLESLCEILKFEARKTIKNMEGGEV